MNQQQPDNFFREKLHNYQRPVPQGAWQKIESALEKKTERKFVWWKVAAVLFLMAGAGYVLWFNHARSNEQHLAVTEPTPAKTHENIEVPKTPDPLGTREPERIDEAGASTNAETKQPEAASTGESKKRAVVRTQKKQDSIIPVEEEAVVKNENPVAAELEVHTVSPTVEPSQPAEKNSTITLTFSAEETNRYLNKNSLAEATSTEKKPSSLKKFLQKANDLKSNQDPFADLRERKNEILALNFKNDKRGQNK